jgi:hypothetical protein
MAWLDLFLLDLSSLAALLALAAGLVVARLVFRWIVKALRVAGLLGGLGLVALGMLAAVLIFERN